MMTYKLFNKLFGWDYIHWTNSADQGISMVRVDGEGKAYYYRYFSINVIDPFPPGIYVNIRWLTCLPNKYI